MASELSNYDKWQSVCLCVLILVSFWLVMSTWQISLSDCSRNEWVSCFKLFCGKLRYWIFTNCPGPVCQWRLSTLWNFRYQTYSNFIGNEGRLWKSQMWSRVIVHFGIDPVSVSAGVDSGDWLIVHVGIDSGDCTCWYRLRWLTDCTCWYWLK